MFKVNLFLESYPKTIVLDLLFLTITRAVLIFTLIYGWTVVTFSSCSLSIVKTATTGIGTLAKPLH